MRVRGIRGATTVEVNEETEILTVTKELFIQICEKNDLKSDDIASIFITVTQDLDATFPAKAIRTLPAWEYVPIICANEIAVPDGLPKCIRMLIHVNTDRSSEEINHVFMKKAVSLRPDLVNKRK